MFYTFQKKDFNNAFWYVGEKMVQLVVAIFIIPKVYNELGPIDLGKFEFSKTMIGYFAPILFLGLPIICIKEIVEYPSKRNEILASALFLRILSCIIILGGLGIYLQNVDQNDITTIIFILGLGYLVRVTDVLEYYIQAKKSSRLLFLCKVSTLVIIVSLQYYGIQKHYSVYYFAYLFGLDFLIQGLIYFIFLFGRNELQLRDWKISKSLSIKLLKNSYPLIISNLLVAFYIGIDELALKYYTGDAAVGIFASVQFLVIWLTWNIGDSFIYALYPAFVEAYTDDSELYKRRVGLSYKLVIGFGILIAVFFTTTGNYIYTNFYDESYHSGILPLQIFSWAPLFVFIGVIYEKHLININELDKNVYRFILGCIVNLILCYFLIPKFEIIGAAVAVLISHIITNLGFILLDSPSRSFFIEAIKSK